MTAKGVEALGRFLVRRMANARTAIIFSAKDARRHQWRQSIVFKLANSRLDCRSIYHPLGIPAAECRLLLAELETEGILQRIDRGWELVKGTTLPSIPNSLLPLEV